MVQQRLGIAWKFVRFVKTSIVGFKNLILRSNSELLKPTAIVYEVTDRCNSRCLHCNIWRRKPTDVVLTPEEIEHTFRDDLFQGVGYIIITGGEAVIRDDIEDVVLRIHRALPHARLQISTNGLLPGRILQVVNAALMHNISLDVGVSLDGIGDDHDKVRGVKGNFDKVDSLLRELIKLREIYGNKLGVAAGIVLSDFTLHSLDMVRAYTMDLGIDLTEQWYNESPFYDNISGAHSFSNEMIAAVKSQPDSPLRERWIRKLRNEPIIFSCFALYTFFLLKCNGDVTPCLTFCDVTAGNVKKYSPTVIWHSTEMKKARETVKNCQGCLNSWGALWSFEASFYPILSFYFRHPRILLKKLCNK